MNTLKTILSIAVLSIMLMFSSCEKERCYTCTTRYHGDNVTYRETTKVYCGVTASDISLIEQMETTKLTSTNRKYKVTTCKKQ